MKPKIIIVILSLIVACFFLTSCGTDTTSTSTNYKQGTGNVILTTLSGYPSDTIYPNSEFKIVVKVDNQGAYKLNKGIIKILGFDEKYISLTESKKSITSLEGNTYLDGKSSTNPNGEFTFIEFGALAKNLFPGSESYSAPYFIKAEYEYQTDFSQTVCINTNLYEVQDSGCKVTTKTSFSGQGSPLAITEMEELISPGALASVDFRLTLKNAGKGKVKQVTLNKATLSNQPMKCIFNDNPGQKTNSYEFKDKEEVVILCKQNLDSQKASYSSVIYLDLSFNYILEESKTLTLKK